MSPMDLSYKARKLDKAMDVIRDRYGADTIMRAGAMGAGRNVGRKHKAQIELKKVKMVNIILFAMSVESLL